MRTWFLNKKDRLALEQPEDQSLAGSEAIHNDLKLHRSLDAGLKKTLQSKALQSSYNREKQFAKKFEAALKASNSSALPAYDETESGSSAWSWLTGGGMAPLKFASLLLIPFVGFIAYSQYQKSRTEYEPQPGPPQMEDAASVSHEAMAPDVENDSVPSPKEMAAKKLGAGFPNKKDRYDAVVQERAMIDDETYAEANRETVKIQEELLLKNLDMAPNVAAKKSATKALVDFYKKNEMKEKAARAEKDLQNLK